MAHPMSDPWLDWQPEPTAPKDGELLLVCEGELSRPALTWWHHTSGWMNGDGRSGKLFYKFGKWARIPLPQPLNSNQRERQMPDPEVDGLKAEIERLRKENQVQRTTIDELVSALASAQQLCTQLADALNKHRPS